MWLFNRLSVRIFVTFSCTLAFFIALVVALPLLDARNLTYLSSKEKESGVILAKSIENELTHVQYGSFRWWIRVIVVMNNLTRTGQHLFVVTPTEQIITAETNNLEIVRNFHELSVDIDDLAKKAYQDREILGPFLINYANEQYRLYILQPAQDVQYQWVSLILDHPFWLFILTMFISSPLLIWLSCSLAKPARQLKIVAERVARGDIQESPELENLGSAEYQATGASFNHMLRELKRLKEAQQQLLSDISHELRTPLTRLKLAASLIRRKQGESSEIQRIEKESLELDAMIEALLQLARQQYNNEVREIKKIQTLWQDVLINAEFEAEQINKKFTIKQNSSPMKGSILCYPFALRSALENVIRNAFRYSDHQIEVNFIVTRKDLTIIVDDDGPGVSENELTQIFRPFYRTSEARDRESGGTGLGLSIVVNSITRDNGTVKAQKSPLGGLQIVITLPLYKK